MNQLNDVRVDRYLELFPDESAVLGHVMKIGRGIVWRIWFSR